MDLNAICFDLFVFLFLGYLLLEGFDYGAGMLLPFLGKTDKEKQAIVQTMAPVWEGNEVWLIAAGAVLFAGFPHVYATLFSGLYLALLLILVTLILRGVAFEFRDKDNNLTWRKFWDWAIFFGSIVPSLLWGIAITNLLLGLPIDGEKQYIGSFWNLLSPYSLMGGLVFVLLFLLHGSVYLTLRLDHPFTPLVRKIGLISGKYALLLSVVFIILSFLYTDLAAKLVPVLALVTLFVALIFCCSGMKDQQYLHSFIFSTAAIISIVSAIFSGLFPRFIVSTLNPAWNLTIYNSASNPLTLRIMTVTMSIVLPVLLLIQAWKYHIFRARITIIDSGIYILLAQLHGQLMKLRAHSYHLIAIIKKGKKSFDGNNIRPDNTTTAEQLQKFRGLIQYGHRVANTIAKVIGILRK